MKSRILRAWLAGTVFSSLTVALIPGAMAQTASQVAPTQGLSTINVVARKRVENVQKVPLSITVVTAHVLKQAHVENLHDLAALTPGVNVSDIGAEAGTAITIRGVSDLTFGVGVPDVATFLDFQYLRDPAAININAIPLADVEIIKDPSSALYGRDAYSGVIDYSAARPTTTPHAEHAKAPSDSWRGRQHRMQRYSVAPSWPVGPDADEILFIFFIYIIGYHDTSGRQVFNAVRASARTSR